MPDDQLTASNFAAITEAVCDRLARNVRVRRNLPGEGRLRFDRQLPFLCVYRRPAGSHDIGTVDLVTSEAAYLFASGEPEFHDDISALCRAISREMREHYGVFLFLEIWADHALGARRSGAPAFRIVTPEAESLPSTIDVFTEALQEIELDGAQADVRVQPLLNVAPPGMRPLVDTSNPELAGVFVIGLAVRPVYRQSATSTFYPLVLRALRRQLSMALRKAIYAFTGMANEEGKAPYHSLGPTTLVKATRLVDQQLTEISQSFDFLLQVTPTNSEDAWQQFEEASFRHAPRLHYRPLPYDPRLLKRRLFEAPIERIEDVTLAHLLWEKMDELDRQLTALMNLATPDFLYSSLQLYGGVENSLLELAHEILRTIPHAARPIADDECVTAETVAQAAREEIDLYHGQLPDFHAIVELNNTIASSIMVVHDKLLISETARLRRGRVAPLLHHEIGTHLLTFFNGRQQPLRQLFAGLAGYEALQEGLAVLAEYLVGGLTPSRMRMLAARVVAVRARIDGLPFTEAFRLLHEEHRLAARVAFTTVLRAYRAGGLTKDAIYLRGLRELLEYLAAGHEIEPLYVGKLALEHVPHVQELRRRGIVSAPALLPRFWADAAVRERLERCRNLSVLQLLENPR
jgi:uncharacterized protein (TIGR02421 family)